MLFTELGNKSDHLELLDVRGRCHAPGPPPEGDTRESSLWVINLSANWCHLFLAYLRAASFCEDKKNVLKKKKCVQPFYCVKLSLHYHTLKSLCSSTWKKRGKALFFWLTSEHSELFPQTVLNLSL